MGKRKHEDKDSRIRKKIKRLQKQLMHTSSESDSVHELQDQCSPSYEQDWGSISGSDDAPHVRSAVIPTFQPENLNDNTIELEERSDDPVTIPEPSPSTSKDCSAPVSLPQDILEALGDSKGKDEVFGPPIPDEISKRWGCILVDGLTKEQKQETLEKSLIPENFKLIKAPILNPEIVPVLSDSVRNRDKILEKAQNHLGYGIAGLTNLTCSIIEGNMDKIELLKKISDTNKILLDLHYENTKTRRKLVITSLDKKFTHLISDVKRDTFLFGANLGDKIKASKAAERSGFQIKRNDSAPAPRKYPQQGNWRGPPISQGQQARRQGGPKSRYHSQTNKRSTPATYRQSASKTNARTNKS